MVRNAVFPYMTGLLHMRTHRNCGYLHKTCRGKPVKNSSRDGKGAHEAPPLTEMLLAINNCQGRENHGIWWGLDSGSLHIFPPTPKYMWAALISLVA